MFSIFKLPDTAYDHCKFKSLINNVNGTNTMAGQDLSVGSTTITWTATDSAGNSSQCTTVITVDAYVSASIVVSKSLSVNPNPVKYLLSVEGITTGTYKIINTSGIVVAQGSIDHQINLSALASGVYVIELKTGKLVKQLKIIKE